MPNFTLSEILTIALVILIVFGPQRLPEMAKKTGQVVRKARQMASDLRREFEGEFQDVAQPLKEVGDELKGVGQDVGSSLHSLSDEVARAKEDVDAELAKTSDEVTNPVTSAEEAPPDDANRIADTARVEDAGRDDGAASGDDAPTDRSAG
jgi:sec-independent protein translocase protein TatB